MPRFDLFNGDCLEVMPHLDKDSFDSIVTDPPYGLSFMGKDWDHGIPGVEFWQAALRVAKPGAHLLAFGGTRTHHRLMVAIEDAGWEIRDTVMWVYGSGFPKSHDVSKAIDREAGAEREKVRVTASKCRNQKAAGGGRDGTPGATRPWIEKAQQVGYHEKDGETPVTSAANQWQGWGTALKPAWEPIIIARKPLEGTVAENVLTWGTGAINIGGSRVKTEESTERPVGKAVTFIGGWSNKHSGTPAGVGRWPANLIHDGSDEVVGLFPQTGASKASMRGELHGNVYGGGKGPSGPDSLRGHDDSGGSAARFFYCAKASKRDRDEGCENMEEVRRGAMQGCVDGGNFLTGSGNLRKPVGRNYHPTVKPTSLMRYLVRLVTPPGGVVLDPFMGSGSTGKAAILEGFSFVGIELNPEYVDISRARIEFAEVEFERR